MKVKELVNLFSADTAYNIKSASNPHDLIWWGRGNKNTNCVDEEEILGVQNHKNKIIIYIS
jgi:hypothetical protein